MSLQTRAAAEVLIAEQATEPYWQYLGELPILELRQAA